jgi:hypothetical protein
MKIDIKIGGKWRAAERGEEPSGVLMSLKTGVCCAVRPPHYSQNGAHTRSLHPINPSRHSGLNTGGLFLLHSGPEGQSEHFCLGIQNR